MGLSHSNIAGDRRFRLETFKSQGAPMADEDLKSFKIGDIQAGAPTGPVTPKQSSQPSPESQSVGFARIEKLLESETPDGVSTQLTSILGSLEQFGADATTPKDKSASKKAIAAVERAADLMDYLFQTKVSMEGEPAG
jgi:hypothetical protein